MQETSSVEAVKPPSTVFVRRKSALKGRKPTIAYFDHTAILSGGEIALQNLILNLDKEQFEPVVIFGADGPMAQRLRDAAIEVHILPLDSRVAETRKDSLKGNSLLRIGTALQSIRYTFRLARFLRARKADLLHTNSLKADILGGVAAHMASIPVIWHVRDRIADDYLPGFASRVFRLCCRVMPDYIIANSKATMETLSTGSAVRSAVVHSGSTSRQLKVVHDGISDFAHPPRLLETKNPIIGLVGRISPWKGQHIFINAAAEVVKLYPGAQFQMIGSAMFGEEAYEAEVKKLVTELGLDDNIVFAGFCEDVFDKINALDILVHASTTGEPFGQVVVEGMVAGKPVVATRGGGVLEIVVEGETGYLVPMDDASAMAEAVIKLLMNPGAAHRMGLRGRARVLQRFTIDITTHKIQDIYSEFFE